VILNVCQPGLATCHKPPQIASLNEIAVDEPELSGAELGGAELPQAVTAAASKALAAAQIRPRVRMDFLGDF
jgi:hypothetical protein